MSEKVISCVIVDDETPAHAILENYIARLDFIDLKGKFLNAIEAYNYLRKEPVDVIFLDINMPQVDGFSLLEMLDTKPMVIITTAHAAHALKSFEYHAIDYLQKPIRFERFVTSVEKAVKWKKAEAHGPAEIIHLTIKADGYLQDVSLPDIIYIESMGNYIRVHLKNRMIVTFMTTKEMEDKLPPQSFVRIHKSYIINMAHVTNIQNDTVFLGRIVLPVGKTYKKYLDYFLK